MKRIVLGAILGAIVALLLGGCVSTGAVPEGRMGQAQEALSRGRSAYLVASVALATYRVLPVCGSPEVRSACRDLNIDQGAATVLTGLKAALDLFAAGIRTAEGGGAVDLVALSEAVARAVLASVEIVASLRA